MKFMRKRYLFILGLIFCHFFMIASQAHAFWVWTPESGRFRNPKYAVKDTPREQFNWAMEFFNRGDFEDAAREFKTLVAEYPDSEYAPDAQYYAGRSYEEIGKYYPAFKQYQEVAERYPFSDKLSDVVERQFFIAEMFRQKETPRLMDLELSMSLDRAVEIYEKVIRNMPRGEYADKDYFKKAECYRRMRKHREAIDAYNSILDDYPNSDLLEEVKYQRAYTKYEAALASDYDQRSTMEALEEFRRIYEEIEAPEVIEEARRKRLELEERKARSDLRTAEFYLRRNQESSALMYLKDIVEKFPDTQAAGEARKKIEAVEGSEG